MRCLNSELVYRLIMIGPILANLYTGCFDSIWLNCVLGYLTLAELFTWCFDFWLTCLQGDLNS